VPNAAAESARYATYGRQQQYPSSSSAYPQGGYVYVLLISSDSFPSSSDSSRWKDHLRKKGVSRRGAADVHTDLTIFTDNTRRQ